MNLHERLQQATAAVIQVTADDRQTIIGTAWLARSPGTMITAGHVLFDSDGTFGQDPPLKPLESIRLKFLNGPLEKVRILAGPVLKRPIGVDVVVLELEEPSDPNR